MKKLIAILVVLLVVITFASCGAKETVNEGETDNPVNQEETSEPVKNNDDEETSSENDVDSNDGNVTNSNFGEEYEIIVNEESLAIKYSDGKEYTIAKVKSDDDITKTIVDFVNVMTSLDKSKIYFETSVFATSNAIHMVDVETFEESYISDGYLKEVIDEGPYKGDLIVHKGNIEGDQGRVFKYYIVDDSGKEIVTLGDNINPDFISGKLSYDEAYGEKEEEEPSSVVVGDAEDPEPYPQYEFFVDNEVDLDGDGVKDNIRIELVEEGEYLIINVNDKNLSMPFDYGINTDVFRIVDIDIEDDYKEIVLTNDGPSNDPTSEFYYYDGKEVKSMGYVEGHLKVGPYDSEVYIEGSGGISAPKRLTVFNGLSYEAYYILDDSHNIKLKESDKEFYIIDFTATTVEKIKVYSEKSTDGNQIEIKADEKIHFSKTDNKEWINATWDGKNIWINTKEVNYFQFSGLPFFD